MFFAILCVYNEEKRSLKFFLGSLCMALVAGCRPQMLLLTFLAIPLFFRTYIIEKEFKTKKGIKEFDSDENNNYIILLTDDISNITYQKIKSMISNSGNGYMKILNNILKSVNPTINPPMIGIQSTVDFRLADSPSLNTSEITYYKSNKSGGVALRYSGKIKPTFIKSSNDINFNYTYSKRIITDQNYKQYSKYKSTGYLPQYPSIDYTDIVNNGKTIYEDKDKILTPDKIEYTIYKDSICYNLLPDISTSIESVIEKYKVTREELEKYNDLINVKINLDTKQLVIARNVLFNSIIIIVVFY